MTESNLARYLREAHPSLGFLQKNHREIVWRADSQLLNSNENGALHRDAALSTAARAAAHAAVRADIPSYQLRMLGVRSVKELDSKISALEAMCGESVIDLLSWLPRHYLHRYKILAMEELRAGLVELSQEETVVGSQGAKKTDEPRSLHANALDQSGNRSMARFVAREEHEESGKTSPVMARTPDPVCVMGRVLDVISMGGGRFKKTTNGKVTVILTDDSDIVHVQYFRMPEAVVKRIFPINAIRMVHGVAELHDPMVLRGRRRSSQVVHPATLRRAGRSNIGTTLGHGELSVVFTHPDYVVAPEKADTVPKIEPIYRLKKGLTQKFVGHYIQSVLAQWNALHPNFAQEWLLGDAPLTKRWSSFRDALRTVHHPWTAFATRDVPPTVEEVAAVIACAKERLAVDEMLAYGLVRRFLRAEIEQYGGLRMGGHLNDQLNDQGQTRERLQPQHLQHLLSYHPQHAESMTDLSVSSKPLKDSAKLVTSTQPSYASSDAIDLVDSVVERSVLVKRFVAGLPFTLTEHQQQAGDEILLDMAQPRRMLRVLQGDVGSGKTVVALMAMLQAVASGYQAVLMAPTEILARQHFAFILKTIEGLGVASVLCLGANSKAIRRQAEMMLQTGQAQMAVGTHALLEEGVNFDRLGLVVIDEQHRFGVEQRLRLIDKARHADLLMVTATPIPRTMMMMAGDDLRVSTLREGPHRERAINTVIVRQERVDDVIARLAVHLQHEDQAFWVCPAISVNDDPQDHPLKVSASMFARREKSYASADMAVDPESQRSQLSQLSQLPQLSEAASSSKYQPPAAVLVRAASLKRALGEDRVFVVHGKMPSKLKDSVMETFRKTPRSVLLATTVIEVGVDVPSATIMIIEEADRFGMTQLHQLRGRVGRNNKPSQCVLLRRDSINPDAEARLRIIRSTLDGFVIAEQDVELRGAGEDVGLRQSGAPGFRFAEAVGIQSSLRLATQIYKQRFEPALSTFFTAVSPNFSTSVADTKTATRAKDAKVSTVATRDHVVRRAWDVMAAFTQRFAPPQDSQDSQEPQDADLSSNSSSNDRPSELRTATEAHPIPALVASQLGIKKNNRSEHDPRPRAAREGSVAASNRRKNSTKSATKTKYVAPDTLATPEISTLLEPLEPLVSPALPPEKTSPRRRVKSASPRNRLLT